MISDNLLLSTYKDRITNIRAGWLVSYLLAFTFAVLSEGKTYEEINAYHSGLVQWFMNGCYKASTL